MRKNILLVITLILVAGTYWYVKTTAQDGSGGDQIVCTQDAKLCPDGSYMSRAGPDCEFAACPEVDVESENTAIDTSTWKTYRNEEYGFEVQYPPDWKIEEQKKFQRVKWSRSGPTDDFGGDFIDGGLISISIRGDLKEIPPITTIKNKASILYDYANYDIDNIEEFSIYGFWGGRGRSVRTGDKRDAIDTYVLHNGEIYNAYSVVLDPGESGITAEKYFIPMLSTFKFIK